MAGRKPIDDDRKRKAVTMNVSNKDLKILDNFIRKNGLSSRSYFLYRVVYGYINGNYVKKIECKIIKSSTFKVFKILSISICLSKNSLSFNDFLQNSCCI